MTAKFGKVTLVASSADSSLEGGVEISNFKPHNWVTYRQVGLDGGG